MTDAIDSLKGKKNYLQTNDSTRYAEDARELISRLQTTFQFQKLDYLELSIQLRKDLNPENTTSIYIWHLGEQQLSKKKNDLQTLPEDKREM